MTEMQLPNEFDPREAAEAALTGQAEAAAASTDSLSTVRTDVPLNDLLVETPEGSLLTTPEGSAFAGEALLLAGGEGSYGGDLSPEAALPYGEFTYPLLNTPRFVPVFNRVRTLTPVGPFRVGLDLGISSAFNNNVFGEPNGGQGDLITTFMPTVFVEAGTRGSAQLLYAPTLINYAKNPELGSVNQAVFFRLRYPFTKLKTGLDAFYLTTSGLFLANDAGGFSEQSTLLARVFGEYPLTQKITMDLTAEGVWQNSDPGGAQADYSVRARWYWEVAPSLKAGISLKAGLYEAPVEDQVYQAVQALAVWRATESLSFSGEAGVEMRHLSVSEEGRSELGVFVANFQADYNPSSNVLFNVTFYRDVLNTTFNDVTLNITTGVNASVLIRFIERINFRLRLGAGTTEQITDQQSEDGRYSFVQGGVILSYQFLNRVEVQVFDNLQQRFGSTVGVDYWSNTLGLGLILKF